MPGNKKLIILAAAVLMIFGCQRAGNNKEVLKTDNKTPETVIEAVTPAPAADAREMTLLKDQNRQLTNAITAKDSEISRLKAELASALASNGNMQAKVADANKAKRNVSFIAALSVVLNLIFIWFLIRAKRSPKRLALPEARENKTPESDKPGHGPASPANEKFPGTAASKEKPVKTEDKKPAKRGRPAGSSVKKAGRPPKKQTEEPPLPMPAAQENPEEK